MEPLSSLSVRSMVDRIASGLLAVAVAVTLLIALPIGAAGCRSGHAVEPMASKPSAGGEILSTALVALVRDRFFDAERAAAWAERHATLDPRNHEAVRAALAELGTSHTELITPDDQRYAAMRAIFPLPDPSAPTQGSVDRERIVAWSAGVDATRIGDRWFIRGVVPGGPAASMGLLRGDEIVAADGAPFEPVRSLEGRSSVEWTIRREAGGPTIERIVPVVCEPVRSAWRSALTAGTTIVEREVDGAVVRVGILPLFAGAGLDLLAEMEAAISGPLRHADALVLDLRDGFGGCSPEYVRPFLDGVPSIVMSDREGRSTIIDPQWRGPLVLLVNGGTRSGKEMVARALQRSGRATLVGERTAGAVLGGSAFLLDDGAILYLAVRDVLVDGERLEGVGVEPERIVPDDLRYAAGRDRQRDAAIEVAVTIARAGNRTNSHHSLEHSHDATGSPFHRFDD